MIVPLEITPHKPAGIVASAITAIDIAGGVTGCDPAIIISPHKPTDLTYSASYAIDIASGVAGHDRAKSGCCAVGDNMILSHKPTDMAIIVTTTIDRDAGVAGNNRTTKIIPHKPADTPAYKTLTAAIDRTAGSR